MCSSATAFALWSEFYAHLVAQCLVCFGRARMHVCTRESREVRFRLSCGRFDLDGRGVISHAEFSRALVEGGQHPAMANQMMNLVDLKGEGEFTLADIMAYMKL